MEKKGNNQQKKGNINNAPAQISSSSSEDFKALMKAGREIRKKFYADDTSICFRYQRSPCTSGSDCQRRHICIGCGSKKRYDECVCLNSQFNSKLYKRG